MSEGQADGPLDADHPGSGGDVRDPATGVHAGDQLGDGSGVPAVRPLEHVLYAIVNDRDEPTGGGACRVCGRILWTRVRGSLPTMSRPCTGPPGLSVWR